MSYILTALNKADQEREKNPGPESHTGMKALAGGEESQPTKGDLRLIGIIVAALVISVGLYFFVNTILTTTGAGQTPAIASEAISVEPVNPVPVMAEKPLTNSSDRELPDPATSQYPPLASTTSAAEKPFPVNHPTVSSPEDLNITGYIYFENRPELSKVFVDGEVYRLGDQLPQGGFVSSFSSNHFGIEIQGRHYQLSVR